MNKLLLLFVYLYIVIKNDIHEFDVIILFKAILNHWHRMFIRCYIVNRPSVYFFHVQKKKIAF